MKAITLFLGCLLSITSAFLFAQEKAPVAEDDFCYGYSLQKDTLFVCLNDFAYNGHAFKIVMVFPSEHGITEFNDSLIFHTPDMYFGGLDSLRYIIKDLENGMFSEAGTVYLQIENNGFGILNNNNVHCRINACGVNFWDIYQYPYFEVPATSGKMTVFSSSFWLGGFDEQGTLRVAADRYRMFGADFYPGPVTDSIYYTTNYDIKWNRVWKLDQSEILFHRTHWKDVGYAPVTNILEWPGNGDTTIGQAPNLAPYFDLDNDGFYNAYKGDFPVIKGDQAIFLIYNDQRDDHNNTGSEKMGIDIQVLFYQYDRPGDSALNETVFADYKVFNRSEHSYNNVHIAFFVDFDLGSPWDDYIGCDSLLHSAYCYNGTEEDGSGASGEYGFHPPAQGITCLNFEMSGFISFMNSASGPTSDPASAYEYYNFMQGIWRDSTHLTYGGNGYGGAGVTDFAYSGNPLTGQGWSEVSTGNIPGDRRGIVSSGPYSFQSGDVLEFEMALVFARDYSGNNLSSVGLLKERIASVRAFYNTSPGVGKAPESRPGLLLYPNPFTDYLNIITGHPGKAVRYDIYNLVGKAVTSGQINPGDNTGINLKLLDAGIYFIRVSSGNLSTTRKIIKQTPG